MQYVYKIRFVFVVNEHRGNEIWKIVRKVFGKHGTARVYYCFNYFDNIITTLGRVIFLFQIMHSQYYRNVFPPQIQNSYWCSPCVQ